MYYFLAFHPIDDCYPPARPVTPAVSHTGHSTTIRGAVPTSTIAVPSPHEEHVGSVFVDQTSQRRTAASSRPPYTPSPLFDCSMRPNIVASRHPYDQSPDAPRMLDMPPSNGFPTMLLAEGRMPTGLRTPTGLYSVRGPPMHRSTISSGFDFPSPSLSMDIPAPLAMCR